MLFICPQCGFENEPGNKFCNECGQNLAAIPEQPSKDLSFDEKIDKIQRYLPKGVTEKILSQREKIEGEQKHVTVMFCDMEGFTSLSDRMSPEEAYSLMDQVYEILIHKVHDYGGTVNEMTGDGIMALFGAPIALEDAPQRAIRSAISIHREMVRFNENMKHENPSNPTLKMRIGVHTGPVVVGTLGNDLRVEFKAVGDTVNLASRMEGLAEAGTTYVTEDTFNLTEGFFRFEGLGEKKVKGKDAPIRVFRVIATSTRRTRFDVNAERGLTPFVGRERELEILIDGFERAKAGRGQAFSIISEAGLGKSRLLYEFRKAIANEDMTFLEGKCLSYSRSIAYHPIIDILKSNFNVSESESDFDIRGKVKNGLKLLKIDEVSTLPYFLELLSVKDSGIEKIQLSAEGKKDSTIQALKQICLKGSEIRPLIMATEDLHWIDKSSEDALKELLDSISGARILLIFTYRPEFIHTWGGKSYHSQINLNRLSNRGCMAMVTHLLGSNKIEPGLEDLILEKTEGVPFFVEEFVRTLRDIKIIEKKDDTYLLSEGSNALVVPSRIQDMIMARVDTLPEGVKEVLLIGSVIGREFDYNLLKEITEFPEQQLLSYLSTLRDSELIYERGIYPLSTYIFKHALTQEVVYQSLLKSNRQKYHLKISDTLEQNFPDLEYTQPEILGYHFTEAALVEKAIYYWEKAGEIAVRRSAYTEAIDHLSKGLELLRTSPETNGRNRQELSLLIQMLPPISAIKGIGSTEIYENLIRAQELCDKTGDTQRLCTILRGLAQFYLIRSDNKTCLDYSQKLLDLAQNEQKSIYRLLAHMSLGQILLYLGEFGQAKSHIAQVLTLYDPEKHNPVISLSPDSDMKVVGLSHMADVLWFLGYPDKAHDKSNEALSYAKKISHPISIVNSLRWASRSYALRGDMKLSQKYANEALKMSKERHFSLLVAISNWWSELSFTLGEDNEPLIKSVCEANDTLTRSLAGNNGFSYRLTFIAEIYNKIGQIDKALDSITEAEKHINISDEVFWEAEVYRVKGEIFKARSAKNRNEAESCFYKSLEIARRQQSKSLELRAAKSLARLWRSQDRQKEAFNMLAPVYEWFTEGHDTADLKDAKALIDELS
jgi:class 3 adenylate cyclase/predicted ATPase